MICRVENTQTWILSYNEENRLSKVEKVSGTCSTPGTTQASWTNTYDGKGTRVKQAYYNGTTTTTTHYYAGGSYEVQDVGGTNTVVRYYVLEGRRVAMLDDAGEIGETLQYFLADRQGSTIAVLSDTGTIVSEQRYKAFGEVRGDLGPINETDFGYTGQRGMDVTTTELMDYNARFYQPSLGRFTQPDTIVPNSANPQSLNRYAFTVNNPIRYTDPSGHKYEEDNDSGKDRCDDKKMTIVYIQCYLEDGFDMPPGALPKGITDFHLMLAWVYLWNSPTGKEWAEYIRNNDVEVVWGSSSFVYPDTKTGFAGRIEEYSYNGPININSVHLANYLTTGEVQHLFRVAGEMGGEAYHHSKPFKYDENYGYIGSKYEEFNQNLITDKIYTELCSDKYTCNLDIHTKGVNPGDPSSLEAWGYYPNYRNYPAEIEDDMAPWPYDPWR